MDGKDHNLQCRSIKDTIKNCVQYRNRKYRKKEHIQKKGRTNKEKEETRKTNTLGRAGATTKG